MAKVINKGTLFPEKIMTELITGVKGESSLAKMAASEPLPIVGKEYLTFNIDGEANIVGEGEAKPAGDATVGSKTMVPIKLVLQHRVSSEFLWVTEEERIPYLRETIDQYRGKIARALDIAGISGINPGNGQQASFYATNSIEGTDTYKEYVGDGAVDTALNTAIADINANGHRVNGLIFAPKGASDMGMVENKNGDTKYADFAFGGIPERFAGHACDMNSTVDFVTDDKNLVLAGDFTKFKWAINKDMKFEAIEYGDPDGLGDLKKLNQICLRAECVLGWMVVDPTAFALVKDGDKPEDESESN